MPSSLSPVFTSIGTYTECFFRSTSKYLPH
jgi:hypothetical protein